MHILKSKKKIFESAEYFINNFSIYFMTNMLFGSKLHIIHTLWFGEKFCTLWDSKNFENILHNCTILTIQEN